jgi:phosphatidylserine/phosphatidylglycerophosphate/cardiolipin synthase-like enzyme
VRFGENNADGSLTEPLFQNLYAIRNAQSQILINEQLLYDPSIIEALVEASVRGVKVFAILESFAHEGASAPYMPNGMFLDILLDAGVQIRWKNHPHSDVFVPEHHGKTISVDGFTVDLRDLNLASRSLIIGSANKDILTMRGGFRELQAEVFDPTAQLQHDRLFWENWKSDQLTSLATKQDVQQGTLAEKLKKSETTMDEFLSYLRGFILALYTAQNY